MIKKDSIIRAHDHYCKWHDIYLFVNKKLGQIVSKQFDTVTPSLL